MSASVATMLHRPRNRRLGLFTRIVSVLIAWQERANQRHALASLSDPALRDLGLSRADVEAEASKPFWRV